MPVFENVRLSFVHLDEPWRNKETDPYKYTACVMIEKSDKSNLKKLRDAQEAAVKVGVADGKIPAKMAKGCKRPETDGDFMVEQERRGPEFANHVYFNANSDVKSPPKLRNKYNEPELNAGEEFYSGAYYHIDINLAAFDGSKGGSPGVGAYIVNVMKVADGDRLDGRRSAEQSFAGLAIERNVEDEEVDMS